LGFWIEILIGGKKKITCLGGFYQVFVKEYKWRENPDLTKLRSQMEKFKIINQAMDT
jgi:hypothetical protein